MSLIYLNGEYKPIEEASINVLDRGFIFGDGIYEVIPIFNRKIFRFSEHIMRLENSLKAIYMKNPLKENEWSDIFYKLIGSLEESNQSIYLQITRGVSKRDHDITIASEPTVFVMTRPMNMSNFSSGIKAITHEDIRWKYCDIKAITLLPSILLRYKAKEQGARETILVRNKYITEGAASNVFVCADDKILTPPKSNHVLSGITRDLLIEILLSNDLPLIESLVDENTLMGASEIWITSSTWEIIPVVELDGKLVGSGKPGPLWQQANQLYQEFKHTYCN